MEEILFYYSADGSDVQGPVTENNLHQLFRDKVIGPTSYFCPQGETEWRQLNPENIEIKVLPPQPKVIPVIATVPIPQLQGQVKSLVVNERTEDSTFHMVLGMLCYVITFGGAILSTCIRQSKGIDADSLGGVMGGLVGGILIIATIPYLVSLAFSRYPLIRLLVRVIGMVFFTLLLFASDLVKK